MSFNFNDFTPEQFDAHIEQSIPGFSDLTQRILDYSEYFIQSDTNVYDLGCSSGALIKRMVHDDIRRVKYIGVDNCEMIPQTLTNHLVFRKEDLWQTEMHSASFITSVFTLQFLSESLRQSVLKRVKEGLKTSGAFLVCEKVRSQSAQFQDMHNSLYYQAKFEHFDGDEILEKEKDLRGCMRIKTMNQLFRELNQIGTCEVIWKNFNFVAILVIKD